MDGVTILREISIEVQNTLPFFILAGISLICLIIFTYLDFKNKEDYGVLLIFLSFYTALFLSIGVSQEQNNEENLGQKYYDILIDDTVKVNEFFKHYEIEKIDGKIYTVKEIGSID